MVWVHEAEADHLLNEIQSIYKDLFPTTADNKDVTPIVNERHFERLNSYVNDASAKGARIVVAGDDNATQRRLPLRMVVNPSSDSEIAQHEIFGPALVVRTYQTLKQAVTEINAGERPLALYYFGTDSAEQAWVLDHTLSGGVSINDVVMHPALHDAPFGGVGASGMGHYHGHEGFLEFSHARSVYSAGGHDPRREWGMLPPYTDQFAQMIRGAITP